MLDFEKWMKEIDALLVSEIGVSSDDLPDHDYMDCFADQMTPQEVADEILDEELRAEGIYLWKI